MIYEKLMFTLFDWMIVLIWYHGYFHFLLISGSFHHGDLEVSFDECLGLTMDEKFKAFGFFLCMSRLSDFNLRIDV